MCSKKLLDSFFVKSSLRLNELSDYSISMSDLEIFSLIEKSLVKYYNGFVSNDNIYNHSFFLF